MPHLLRVLPQTDKDTGRQGQRHSITGVFSHRMGMRKYGGTLVYRSRDEQGHLEVVDTHGVRSLHFGTAPRQSAMSLGDPDRLELAYVRAMLAGLLFVPEPRRVLLLGLGGGSLAKFMLRHFAECRIDAVEFRPAVVAVAHRFFGLPEDSRLTVHVTDGGEFVSHYSASCRAIYDLILVDIYDSTGMSPSADRHAFFASGAKLLTEGGVFAINLWGSHPESVRHTIRMLGLNFGERLLRLQVIGRNNVIGFGLGTSMPKPDRKAIEQRAKILEQRLGIEFPRLLHLLSPLR